MTFYGLSLSVDNLVGNVFLNFILLGAADAVATLVFILGTKFVNRHKLTIWCFGAMGVSCTTIGAMQYAAPEYTRVIIGLYVASKFFASCSYTGDD